MSDTKDGPKSSIKGIAQGWAGRTWATTRAAASLGKLAAKKVVDAAIDRAAPSEASDAEDATSDALADRLDEMKGLMMKFGQMLSTLDGALPEQAQRRLARLQSQAKPMEWPQIEEALTQEYGVAPGQVFEALETTPFAAASIGQVHRAKLGTTPVAVKVQYPGVAATLEVDLRNFGGLFRLGTIGTALDTSALVDEMRERVRDECNYLQEAAFQDMFRGLLADDPRVVIPKVHGAHCRERVLVTELASGRSFADFVANAPQEARDQAGTLIFEVAFRSIFHSCVFNGDPHPGNYLFLDDGRVVFLDFGCVRVFPVPFIETWKRIARAMLAEDKRAFAEAYTAAGFVGSRSYDLDAQYDVIRYLYEPMLVPKFRYTHEYVRRSWQVLIVNRNFRKTNLPPEWLLVQRLQWGLYSLLAELRAEGEYRAIFQRWVDGPTVPAARPDPWTPETTKNILAERANPS